MTLICCTVTRERAWLSTDSWLEPAGFESPQALRAEVGKIYARLGRTGLPEIDLESAGQISARKVQVFTKRRFAFVLSGSVGAGIGLGFGARAARNIDIAAKLLPTIWPHIPKAARWPGSQLLAIGWSPSAGHVVGYRASDSDGMQAHSIAAGETLWTPDPKPDCPQAGDIWRLLDRARDGVDVEQLHAEVFKAAHWAACAGRLHGHGVAGRLSTAIVSRNGGEVVAGLDLGLPGPKAFTTTVSRQATPEFIAALSEAARRERRRHNRGPLL